MKTRTLLMCGILGLAASVAEANMATYFARGRTIERISTAGIRLVSERVRMTPRFNPDAKSMRSYAEVSFECDFVLENLTAHDVELLAGFPVSRYRPWSEETPEEALERFTEMSSELQFSVDDHGTRPEVRLDKLDREGQPWIMMFWDMKFAPGERRTVSVDYRILMWFTGLGFGEAPDTAVSNLAFYFSYWFQYVAKTADSWAGKVERAQFEVDIASFERSLRASCHRFGFLIPSVEKMPKERWSTLGSFATPERWSGFRAILTSAFACRPGLSGVTAEQVSDELRKTDREDRKTMGRICGLPEEGK